MAKNWTKGHTETVRHALSEKFATLMRALDEQVDSHIRGVPHVQFSNPIRVKLAVEDFKNVLAEARKFAT